MRIKKGFNRLYDYLNIFSNDNDFCNQAKIVFVNSESEGDDYILDLKNFTLTNYNNIIGMYNNLLYLRNSQGNLLYIRNDKDDPWELCSEAYILFDKAPHSYKFTTSILRQLQRKRTYEDKIFIPISKILNNEPLDKYETAEAILQAFHNVNDNW